MVREVVYAAFMGKRGGKRRHAGVSGAQLVKGLRGLKELNSRVHSFQKKGGAGG